MDHHYQIGFCRPVLDQGFEFHFTALQEATCHLFQVNYYKMPFRKDLISVMKSCGGIPESSMDSYVKTIKERNEFEKKAREKDLMLAKAQEEIA